MLASVRPRSYLEFIAGGDLSLVCPQRREPTVKCCDQAVEVALSGFQRANLGSQPRHRPKPDNLVAFHAGSQLYAASQQVARDLLALVGKDPAEVRRLRGICSAGWTDTPLPNSHRGNLTVPLGGCHSGHICPCAGERLFSRSLHPLESIQHQCDTGWANRPPGLRPQLTAESRT